MKVELKKEDKNLSTITVETEPGRALKAYEQTLRALSNNLNLPGFRKGKIPNKMVESHFSAEYVRAQTVNMNFLSELLFEAFVKEKLEVLFIPNIEDVTFDDPKGSVKVTAKIELFPEVKLGKYKGQAVEVEINEFNEEEYTRDTLDRLASQFASYEEINEAVQMKDEIIFDFDGKVNSGTKKKPEWEELPELKATGYQTIVEPGRFIDNFLEQIVGMKKDEEKEIDVAFPAEYGFDKVAGKDAKFKVKVHQVLRANLPELNDDFAKRVGIETLAELKTKIVEEMNKVQDRNKKVASEEAVLNKVTELSTVEITEQMIEREVTSGLARIKTHNNWNQEQLEEFKNSLDLTKERNAAEKNLRRSFIISHLIKSEELKATDEEVDAAVQEAIADPYRQLGDTNITELKQNLKAQVVSDKAVKILIDACKLTYKPHVHGEHCSHNH